LLSLSACEPASLGPGVYLDSSCCTPEIGVFRKASQFCLFQVPGQSRQKSTGDFTYRPLVEALLHRITRPITESSPSNRLWASAKAGLERFSLFAQRSSIVIFSSKSDSAHGFGLTTSRPDL